jgi:hypothetical protein
MARRAAGESLTDIARSYNVSTSRCSSSIAWNPII